MSIKRFDRGIVKGDAIITDEGYIRANAVVTRTGVFLYQNADGTVRKELRHPDDVWDTQSIESMKLIPITNNHPSQQLVNAENVKFLKIGYTGETVSRDDPHVLAKIVVTDKDGIEAIRDFGRKELSLGYTVEMEEVPGVYEGQEYDARQRNIRYNHLAIVDTARAGREARIALDSKDAFEIVQGVNKMTLRKIKIKNDEAMVEEPVAEYIERLENDLKNLLDEKRRVQEEIEMIENKLEKAEGERDSMRDMLETERNRAKESNMDSQSFRKAVSDRIKLYKVAECNLDSNDINRLDSLSDLEIKKLVIKNCRKSINLDGKSHAYLEAMFDTILDDQANNVNTSNVSHADVKADSGNIVENAYRKMIENSKSYCKGV